MSQYKFLFGTTRAPRRVKDEVKYGIDYKPLPKHIIVLHNGHVSLQHSLDIHRFQIVKVDVLDNSGAPLPLDDLKRSFHAVVEQTQTPLTNPLGIASSLDRDTWADIYSFLESKPMRNLLSL